MAKKDANDTTHAIRCEDWVWQRFSRSAEFVGLSRGRCFEKLLAEGDGYLALDRFRDLPEIKQHLAIVAAILRIMSRRATLDVAIRQLRAELDDAVRGDGDRRKALGELASRVDAIVPREPMSA